MAQFSEIYVPKPIAVNGSATLGGNGIGGFLSVTAGNFTLSDNSGTIINAMAVNAGQYYPMPFALQGGGSVTLAGGASGVVGVTY